MRFQVGGGVRLEIDCGARRYLAATPRSRWRSNGNRVTGRLEQTGKQWKPAGKKHRETRVTTGAPLRRGVRKKVECGDPFFRFPSTHHQTPNPRPSDAADKRKL